MESTNSTTRTYTAPTCTLIVATKGAPLPNLTQLRNPHAVDFITLHLDHPEQGESARVSLKGNPLQFDQLQRSVSQYVAELVAKFPLPMDSHNPIPSQQPQAGEQLDDSSSNHLDPSPGVQAPRSGLIQNLPGLRTGAAQPNPQTKTDAPASPSPLSVKNISKLLGRENPDSVGANQSGNKQAEVPTPTAPYLTAGDRPLDHKLHLGNLATPSSGAILTLSAIQLFDLATTLDEYAATVVAPKQVTDPTAPADTSATLPAAKMNTTIYRKGIGASDPNNPPAPADPVVPVPTPISRLPNLPNLPIAPKAPTQTAPSQVYDYTNGNRPAFLSVIPWAAAAALAVGVPLLLFGSKSNSLKELTASVKLPAFKAPDLDAAKKAVMSRLPGQEPTTSSPEPSTGATTTANLPKPWEQQAIQPPKTSPTVPGAAQVVPVNPDKIGIAPLPPTIMGTAAQQSSPTQAAAAKPGMKPAAIASAPGLDSLSGIAPNPLSSPSIPTVGAPSIATTKPTQPKLNNPVTTLPATPAKIAVAAKVSKPTAKINPEIGKIDRGKIAIGKKATVIPPNISVGKAKIGPAITAAPFSPAEIAVAQRIDPVPFKPTILKKAAKSKVKPIAVATKPKTASIKPTSSPFMTQKPITPSPISNPNIINPIPPTSSEGAEVQNPPIVAEPQIQSNVGRNPANPDPFDSPSLQETKRYFQGKWQADPNQTNPLQYVVQVSGKSGVVRSVNPQGEAATEYLKKTGLLKPGQKLVSPAAAGNNDQKIRVLLQPDGNVDAFVEP